MPRPPKHRPLPPRSGKHNVPVYSYPTKCAVHPYIHVGNFWPGEFRAFMSLITPSKKMILKDILGLTEPCGVKLLMRDVDELQVFGNPDLATALIELPELAGGALLWWWLADVGFHAIRAWTSVLHVYHYCTPTAYFGTATVEVTGQIMSGINDTWSALTMNGIIQDPGNWVQIGGSNIHPPIRGLYRVMANIFVVAAFGGMSFSAGIHVHDGDRETIELAQTMNFEPGESKTFILGGQILTITDNPVFNVVTWNHGPAFGAWCLGGSTFSVSSD